MAGVKTSKGQKTQHSKFYIRQQEWKPCKVVTPKRFSKGHKTFMAAQSVSTGEIYKNSHGLIAPSHSIPFTCIEPKDDKKNL